MMASLGTMVYSYLAAKYFTFTATPSANNRGAGRVSLSGSPP